MKVSAQKPTANVVMRYLRTMKRWGRSRATMVAPRTVWTTDGSPSVIAHQAFPATAGGAEKIAKVGTSGPGTAGPVANRSRSADPTSTQNSTPTAKKPTAHCR
ncbi:hypothetical protein BJF88_07700 [Cellulosimicrobium sp. CUA-896]|nr:hypothetical protein BJF88_07700 [Cellulosimicrobium sp. CUA-896]